MNGEPPAPRTGDGRRRIDRRTALRGGCLAAGAALVAAAVDGAVVTPRRLLTSDHTLGSGAAPPLKLAQVSDLHLHGIGTLERQLIERLHESAADLIVFTGDAIDAPGGLGFLDQLLAELPTAARRLAILGNWEHRCGVGIDTLARTYERHDVELLVNRSIVVEHRGRSLRVTGLDDLLLGRPDPVAALADAARSDAHLVLAHCPAARDALGLPLAHPASLVLAGHTHGGQVAPLGMALVRPSGSGRYVAGWYRDGGPPMYVSRGIGTSLLPVRLGAPPELVRIEWRP